MEIWNEVIGQSKVKKLLQKAVFNNKISHAYCFSGAQGVGKEAMSLVLAKTLNCEEPTVYEDYIEACNKCPSCKMANKLQHPNIQLIHSMPAVKSTDNNSISDKLSDSQVEEIREQYEIKSNDLYKKISIPKANQIKIASIREIKKKLTMTSNFQGRQFILVFDAEEMTKEAANAFLKTLEEPTENVTIIICTSKPELILPTILSRCQQVFFEPIPLDELSEYLIKKYNIKELKAKLAVSLGQGSYTKSLEFLDENMLDLRNDTIEIFRTSLKRIYRIELMEQIKNITSQNEKKLLDSILKILILWLRDALSIVKTQSHDFVINKDQIEILEKFSKNFGSKDINSVIQKIETACVYNMRNVNQSLLLLNLFIECRRLLLN